MASSALVSLLPLTWIPLLRLPPLPTSPAPDFPIHTLHAPPRLDSPTPRRALLSSAPPSSTRRSPPPLAAQPQEADVPRWFVEVPRTITATGRQAARSVQGALRANAARLLVEVASVELDPSSASFRPSSLLAIAHAVALELLDTSVLPPSRPLVKLVVSSTSEAALAAACVWTTNVPVSVLGHPSMVEPRDGAFLVVAPGGATPAAQAQANEALAGLLAAAQGRPVVVINPWPGATLTALAGFETAYSLRPFEMAYLEDQYAQRVDRAGACLLRCFPHEWSVLLQPNGGNWTYVGRSSVRPSSQQLEVLCRDGMTGLRFNARMDAAARSAE
ncbi:hypothetical protein AB1Y20_012666 [Prymnesium parvum]|uniref:DUF1995 domain-containing protein n=1 Tax=Prymnesium parvum TaxID=97485 RepID=A0AB34IJE2_PRYPA